MAPRGNEKKVIAEAKKVIADYKHLASILAKDGFSRPVIEKAYDDYKNQFSKQAEKFDNFEKAGIDFKK